MIRRCFFAVLLIMSSTLLAAENEFRCDTEIFVGSEKLPVQETCTIFSGLSAYDFLLTKPNEITLYDFGRGQLTLIDEKNKRRTTLSHDDVLRFTATYKTIKPKSPIFGFCANPTFEEEFTDNNILTMRGTPLVYRVTCIKPDQTHADRRYREFADWSARLNSMRPGNLPPYARIEMNRALAAKEMVPTEIERTIFTPTLTGKRTDIIRTKHLFNWRLSTQDRRRIERVGDLLSSPDLASVSPEEYLGFDGVKAGKK